MASVLELGNDEAYYWLYSQHLQWNYFDHPPMVAIWIRLFTANLWLQDYEVFLRLGSIVSCALSTWFIYKVGSLLSSEKAGWLTACLFNASFYAGITAGLYIMPDSPQIVFWTLSLWMVAKISADDTKWMNWILLGIAAGLCIMSKVHGAFIWIGLGLFILLKKRNWLLKPQLYVSLLLTMIIASPILIWNIQNDFVTYRFHSERVTIHHFSININSFLREFFGQLFFNNPFNVAFILLALGAWRKHHITRSPDLYIYNFIGLPLVAVLLFISLFRSTLPHWCGPAYVTLLPIAAIQLVESNRVGRYLKLASWSLRTYIIVLMLWTLAVYFYPGTVGSKNKKNLGQGDISLDIYGWKDAAKQFAAFYKNEVSKGIMPANAPIVCYKWWGAHIEYYFCHPSGIQMIGIGTVNNLHQYLWMNKWRKDEVNFSKAYCIMPSDEQYDVWSQYSSYYSKIELIKVIEIDRNSKPAHYFYVYRLQGWKQHLPIVK